VGNTLTLTPLSPKKKKKLPLVKPVLPKAAAPKPKALSPSRTVAPRGTTAPKRFVPSRATLPGGRPAVSTVVADTYTTTSETPTSDATVALTDTSALTVTDTATGSEGSVWTDGSASYPTGEASGFSAQETPTELVTEGEAMMVSADVAGAEAGFFAKYKWWIAGGSVGAVGVYAYLHRTNPSKYPLPQTLSKLVRG
jgi:hypothetical protein